MAIETHEPHVTKADEVHSDSPSQAQGPTKAGTSTAVASREGLRAAKNKYVEDGRLATLAVLGDERRDLTANERIKMEKPGPQVWRDIVERYKTGGFASIDPDDFERFKWIGIYQQKPKNGHFMLRVKLPGGFVNNEQLRIMAGITKDYARGISDISTRQAFQMHWLEIQDVPDIMDRLETVGLGVKKGLFGACGDICRNIVSSPLTGIDPNDVLNPQDFVNEASFYFAGNPEYSDLPRKYKIGVFGHRSAGQCEINCLSFFGTRRSDGEVGYAVMAGGGLSTEPHLAQDLGVFVKPEQALETMEAITRIFRDHGYRKNRKHARLKYLVADWGAVKLREEIEKILGYQLTDGEPQGYAKGYEDKLGVFDQVQAGLQWVGVPVVAGRMTDEQMFAVADIAQEHGSGDIRLTVMQSFYIINIPREQMPRVLEKLAAIGLPVENVSAIRKGVVACTGIEFCNLAVTETKERAKNIVNLLDEGVKWSASEFFRVNVNGCPNSCGQHWIADVGLQGCTKKVDGELKEHYDVFLGGALGSNASGEARFNRRITRVSAEEVAPTIQRAIEHFNANRQGEESFADFCARHTDEELAAIL